MDYSTAPTSELLKSYDAILEELRRREVIRNSNPPAGGYAEYLVAKALDLKLENNSNAGYDATDRQQNRYEIKARRVTQHNQSRQLSAIRNLGAHHFDFLVGVIFSPDFSVLKAAIIPHAVVSKNCRFSKHTNSSILILNDNIWDCSGVKDLTITLKQIELQQNN